MQANKMYDINLIPVPVRTICVTEYGDSRIAMPLRFWCAGSRLRLSRCWIACAILSSSSSGVSIAWHLSVVSVILQLAVEIPITLVSDAWLSLSISRTDLLCLARKSPRLNVVAVFPIPS